MMRLATDVVATRVAALQAEYRALSIEVRDGYRSGEMTPFVEDVLQTREHQIVSELSRLGARPVMAGELQ